MARFTQYFLYLSLKPLDVNSLTGAFECARTGQVQWKEELVSMA
jgi:hypothetical protein